MEEKLNKVIANMKTLSNFVKKIKDNQEEYEKTFRNFLKDYEEFKDDSIKDNEKALNFEERIIVNEKNLNSLKNKIEVVEARVDLSEPVNENTSPVAVNEDLANMKSEVEDINSELSKLDEKIEEFNLEIKKFEGKLSQRVTASNTSKTVSEKIFECDICGDEFSLHKTFKEHLRTHHNTSTMNCSECGKCFFAKWRLNLHVKHHHVQKSKRCCHFFNNGKFCPYEKMGCKFQHLKSKICKFGSSCVQDKCQFRHENNLQ